MSQHDDFDRSLDRWLDTEARPAATAEVLDRALGATSRRRPRPRLFAALGSHWVGDSVGPTSGVATVGRTGGRTALALVLLLLVLALVAAAVQVGARLLQPAPVDLGIFGPVAGRIVSGVWAVNPEAVDPSAPSRWTPLRMGPEEVLAVGWSSNGTELLFMRKDPTQTFPFATNLFILHADGTETQLTKDGMEMWGATIAPDGSRVVYAARDVDAARSVPPSLFAGDAKGGQPIRIADEGERPTFSPDGSQIAYVVNNTGGAHVWVADADGSDAHEILADGPTFLAGVDELAWSPTGDRIAMGNSLEGHAAINTFAPDGSDFTKVITGGMNAFWSPDGSQIAYTLPYGEPPGGRSPGLAIADADGSNVREFGIAASGPWHPGTLEAPAEAPASPSASTSLSPRHSSRTGEATFTSTIHGFSIDYPAGWQTRPATEPWTGGELTFDSPAADVIFDPALGDRVYLILASQPYTAVSQDLYPAGLGEEDWPGDRVREWLCAQGVGGSAGSFRFDGARAWAVRCQAPSMPTDSGGNNLVYIYTDTRGYLVRVLVSSDEGALVETYDWDWLKPLLETVDLRPEEAVDAPIPSESP